MAYKSGEDIIFLSEDRSITNRRLWISRAIVFLFWLTPTASTQSISIPYAIGRFLALLMVYWIALRAFSKLTIDVESKKSANPDTLIIDTLSEQEVATRRELVGAALPNSEFEERDECWDKLVKPYLEQHEDIEQLDESGRRWQMKLES